MLQIVCLCVWVGGKGVVSTDGRMGTINQAKAVVKNTQTHTRTQSLPLNHFNVYDRDLWFNSDAFYTPKTLAALTDSACHARAYVHIFFTHKRKRRARVWRRGAREQINPPRLMVLTRITPETPSPNHTRTYARR